MFSVGALSRDASPVEGDSLTSPYSVSNRGEHVIIIIMIESHASLSSHGLPVLVITSMARDLQGGLVFAQAGRSCYSWCGISDRRLD